MINAKRDFFLLLAARIIQLLLALAAVRLATTLLSVEQYGVLALLTGMNALFGLFLINPVGQHISRHTHQWHEEGTLRARLGRYNHYVLAVSVLGLIAAVVWFASRGAGSSMFVLSAGLVTAGMIFAGTWNAIAIPMLNMIGFRMSSMGLAVLTTLLALGASSWLAFAGGTALPWLAGQIIGLGTGAVLGLWLLRRWSTVVPRAGTEIVLIDKGDIRAFCLPLAIATGLLWLLTSGYRFAVEWAWGIQALGLMAAGMGIASQLWGVVETLVIQFVYPHFFKAVSVGDPIEQQVAYSNLINAMVPVYVLLLGVMFSCSGWAMAILVDAKFHGAYVFALIGVAFEWCRVMANLLGQAAQVTKLTSRAIAPYAYSAILAIAAILVAAWLHAPIITVAWILLLAGVVLLSAMKISMHRLIRIKIEWRIVLIASGLAVSMVVLAMMIGLHPLPFFASLTALLFMGVLSVAMLFFIIKNNHAYHAILAVRLQPGEEEQQLLEAGQP